MLDRITGMNVFTAAAAAGSLSAAARKLKISAGMATKHLDALEHRLGTRLFHRTTRKLTLTDAGRRYLETCLRLLPELEQAEQEIASERFEPRGTLRLNAPMAFGVRYLAPLLPGFFRQYPKVAVEMGLNDKRVDFVAEAWDLTVRIGMLSDSSFIARRIGNASMVVCAAPSYWDAHGRPSHTLELGTHNCLGYSLSTFASPTEWCFGGDRQRRVAISGNFRANSSEVLLAAAIAGQGVLYEPSFIVADAIRSGALEPLSLDVPNADLGGIHLVYASNRAVPAKVRAMIDFLAGAFEEHAPWEI